MPRFVVLQGELGYEFDGRVGGILHGDHPRAVLRGFRLQYCASDLVFDEMGKQALKDVRHRRLHDEFPDVRSIRIRVILGRCGEREKREDGGDLLERGEKHIVDKKNFLVGPVGKSGNGELGDRSDR